MCSSPSYIILFGQSLDRSLSKLHDLLSASSRIANEKSPWNLSLYNNKVDYYQTLYASKPHHGLPHVSNGLYSLSIIPSLSSHKNILRHFDVVFISDLNDLNIPSNYQTLSYYGLLAQSIPTSVLSRFLRCVPVGLSHRFDRYWDGYDLFSVLTRSIPIL